MRTDATKHRHVDASENVVTYTRWYSGPCWKAGRWGYQPCLEWKNMFGVYVMRLGFAGDSGPSDRKALSSCMTVDTLFPFLSENRMHTSKATATWLSFKDLCPEEFKSWNSIPVWVLPFLVLLTLCFLLLHLSISVLPKTPAYEFSFLIKTWRFGLWETQNTTHIMASQMGCTSRYKP